MKPLFAFDHCFARMGQWITEKPRAAGITITISVILLIAGWLTAAHYHHMARLAPMPDDISSVSQLPGPTTPAPTTPTVIPRPTQSSQISLQGKWHTVRIKRGDDLQRIFRHLAISQRQLQQILALGNITQSLTKLKPGQHVRLLIDNHRLQQLIFPINGQQQLIITRNSEGFAAEMNPSVAEGTTTPTPAATAPVAPTALQDNSLQYVSLTMHRSLYASALAVGIARAQAYQLVHLFNENETITKNLHRGDQVSVLYHPSNGSNNGYIAIAQLTHKDKTFEAVRFTDPTGHTDYYDANGISLRPLLERAPVHYTHISSYFSAHRWQPILHFFRPHYGVDYAAPYGTPIKAAGDGRIVFLGNKNGYGHTIYIRHIDHYETVYAHMEHFAHNVHEGSKVHQGEVIGYVGSSGLSTGAHLHFEIRYDNTPRNPLTIALPSGNPLPNAYRSQFAAKTRVLLAELETHHQTELAAETTLKNNNS